MNMEEFGDRMQQRVAARVERITNATQERVARIEAQKTSRAALLFRLLRQVGWMWWVVVLSVVSRLVNQYMGIAILVVAAWGLGQVITDPGSVAYGQVMIQLVMFGVAKGIFYYLEHYTGSYIALRLLADMRTDLYQHLEPLAPAGLMQMRSGDIISRAIADVDQIEVFYSQTIGAAVVALLVPLISLMVMSWFSGWLALLFFPFLLAVGIAVPFLTDDLSKKYSPRLRESIADVNAHMTESIQGWREIVSFGRGDQRRMEIYDRNEKLVRVQRKVAEVSGLRDALTESLVAACIASVFVIGLLLSSLGVMSFFDLPAVVALTYTTFGPMIAARNVIYEFNQATASASRLFEIMDQPPVIQEMATTPPADEIEPSIQFVNVFFRYQQSDVRLVTNEEWFAMHDTPPLNGKRRTEQVEADTESDAETDLATNDNEEASEGMVADDDTPTAEAEQDATEAAAQNGAEQEDADAVADDDTLSSTETEADATDVAAQNGADDAAPPREPAWVHADLSFEVPAGSVVALVGASGSGKSTIINLLMRFWDVDAGYVCVGGYDVREFPLDDLRAMMGVVAQRTHIFNGTIKDNLLLGKPNATDAEIEQAARSANIHDFIVSLRRGYKTEVGEMGTRLSGGQRQRLAIARALLKNAPILILDEATSNLDAVNEREIQTSIQQLMRGRTTLIIAHRLSTVVNADKILVMEQGRIVEQGKHAELLSQGGVYARLFANQQDELRYVV